MFMSQSCSDPAANVTARREDQAEPVAVIREEAARGNSRPLAEVRGRTRPAGLADKQAATCLQSYAQWAAFTAGAQGGEFGFGAYFVDDEASGANGVQSSSRVTAYTWTPAQDE
jgi:hypothetical protein